MGLAIEEGNASGNDTQRHPLELTMRRFLMFALAGILFATPAAFAADADDVTTPSKPANLVLPTGAALAADADTAEIVPPAAFRPAKRGFDARRPLVLALYAGTGVVQAYDGITTTKVLKTGGFEANPMMQAITKNEKTLIAAKVGATVATIIGTESLWRNNHRWAAVLVGIAANGAMAAVVNHNTQVLARFQAAK